MTESPRDLLKLLYVKFERESRLSLEAFLNYNVIDCVPEPKCFSEVAEDWQRERNAKLIPSVEYVAGLRKDYKGPMNHYFGYSKGHAKTECIASILNWLLVYSKRPLRAYCAAKDSEQANIISDSMRKQADLNINWYGKKLEFLRNKVVCADTKSHLDILSADISGLQGITPDVLICDELSAWHDAELYTSIFSGAIKRAGHCVHIILTNAGYIGSWQQKIRDTAERQHGRSWNFYEQPINTTLASWMSKEAIEENRKLLIPGEAKRLYDNQWVDLAEEKGYLKSEDITACIVPAVPPPPQGSKVYISADYGMSLDPTALSVVYYDGFNANIIELEAWKGTIENEIKVADVESWIDSKIAVYKYVTLVFDKYQMVSSIQRYENMGIEVKRYDWKAGKQNYLIAESLRTLITNRRLKFTDDAGYLNGESFKDELRQLIIKMTSFGYRFDHERNGHDDRTVAVAMASYEAVSNSPITIATQDTTPIKKSLPSPKKAEVPTVFHGINHAARRNIFGISGFSRGLG